MNGKDQKDLNVILERMNQSDKDREQMHTDIKFIKENIPGLHILNIKPLTEQFNMPFAPIPIPEIGSGSLYAKERYNLTIAGICLMLVGGSVFAIGLDSKLKIKEHLKQHEPDSIL